MTQPFPAILARYPARTLLIFIVVALILCEIVGWPFLRAPAERFMSDRLERSVRLNQPFQVHFVGGIQLKAGGLWISAPEGFEAPYLIDAKNIVLNLRYGDLLDIKTNKDKTGPIRIKTLHVEEADVYLIRHADGKSTWQFDKDENESSRPVPAIENLVVQNGKAIVKDPLTESDLKVDFNTQESSNRKGSNNLAATSKIEAKGKFRQVPIKAELVTDGFLPIAAQDKTQNKTSEPVNSKGWVDYGGVRVDFNGSVSDIFGEKNIKGKFSVKGPSLSTFGLLVSTLLPTTAPFKLEGNIEKSDNVWQADINSARIGASDLSGHFKYDPRPDVPMVEGTLKGERFFLVDLAPAFGATGSSDDSAPDRIFPDRPLDLPSLNRMNAHVIIDLDYVELGKAFDKPMAPFKAELDLNKGKMSLAKVSAKTADGSFSGVISVDAHQVADQQNTNKKHKKPSELPEWRIDVQWKDINLEKWLQVSKNRKETAVKEGKKEIPPAYVTGMLNGKTNLAGKGNSTAELLGSLDGNVSIYIHNGTISHLVIEALGLDIAQALGLMMKGDQSLPMQCAVMNLKAKQGIVTPDVALVDTPVTLILFDGNIDMAQEKLNLRLIAKPKNVSPFTVRSPILVKGTFLKPVVSAKPGPIAARALGAVALAFINPLAAILPFIDPGSKDDHSSCSKTLAEFNKASASKVSDEKISGKAADIKAR